MKRLVSVLAALTLFPLSHVMAATLGPPISHSQAKELGLLSEAEARDLFALWNECRPISFELKFYNLAKAKDLDLTRKEVNEMVRNRIRAARIYTEDYEPPTGKRLEIGVRVGSKANPAFSYLMIFVKQLKDEETGLNLDAASWLKEALEPHRGESAVILYHISQALDEFINEYLRVNESACPNSTVRLGHELDHNPFAQNPDGTPLKTNAE